jgi:hypothetical protein
VLVDTSVVLLNHCRSEEEFFTSFHKISWNYRSWARGRLSKTVSGRPAKAASELRRIKGMFVLLPETAAIYSAWESLVTTYAVSGKPSGYDEGVEVIADHSLLS